MATNTTCGRNSSHIFFVAVCFLCVRFAIDRNELFGARPPSVGCLCHSAAICCCQKRAAAYLWTLRFHALYLYMNAGCFYAFRSTSLRHIKFDSENIPNREHRTANIPFN